MKAIDEINEKENRTPIEQAILWLWLTENDPGDDGEPVAELAAEQLAALEAVANAANALVFHNDSRLPLAAALANLEKE
jgi:hypothetical protein